MLIKFVIWPSSKVTQIEEPAYIMNQAILEIQKLKEIVKAQTEQIVFLENALHEKFKPGGKGALQAEEHFDELKESL